MQTTNEQISNASTTTLDRGELDSFRLLLGRTVWVRRTEGIPTAARSAEVGVLETATR